MTKKKIEIELSEEEKKALQQEAEQETVTEEVEAKATEELEQEAGEEIAEEDDFHADLGDAEVAESKEEKKGIFSKLKDKMSSGDQKDALAELQAANAELKDKNLRLLAEFENFRRRTSKERIEYLRTAGKETLVSLLPILDDFERAFKASEDEEEAKNSGFGLIYQKMVTSFQQMGLTKMEVLEQEFDSEFHEAIAEIPAPSEEMKGKVLDVVENGYIMNEKIIRFAKVVVGK